MDLGGLLLAAFAAGWVDAVVGGGGLIQLPALLLAFPAAAPSAVLATNKIASVFGTATSSATYLRRVRPDRATLLVMAPLALAGSALGAVGAHWLPQRVFRPLILVLLIAVAGYTLIRPRLGLEHAAKHDGRGHLVRAGVIAAGLGAYDGMFGPGTGSFLVFALVGWLGYSFLVASATAKVTNLATNLGAIVVFSALGAPMWAVGLPMGVANLAGGYLGARSAIAGGNRFVRTVFLVVVAGLVVRLGYDLVA